ncbi:MAG: SufE family protein [Deltaproteobacteria bacterium]|nr:SufE family protein [Deltaproteobacteria bacterium]
MSARPSLEEVLESFELLEDWEDRYAYLIDLGKHVAGLPPALKTEEARVKGCTSQVWLVSRVEGAGAERRLHFEGDSDAHIVRGLVSVLLSAYSGRTPDEVLALDIEALFGRLGLARNLSVSRRNGFFSMVERVRRAAVELRAEG